MFMNHLREITEQHPARTALASRHRTVTYGELLKRAENAAAGLSEFGVGARDIVGLSVGEEFEHLVACLALMAVGATQITLSTFDPRAAKERLAGAAGVNIVLCDNVAVGFDGLRQLRWSDVATGRHAAPSSSLGRLLLRTSGTTGASKIVAFDEEQIALQARHTSQYEGQRYLRPASVEHNNGKRHRLYCLFAGGTNVFRSPEEPDVAVTCSELGVSLLDLSLMHAEDLTRRTPTTVFQGITVQTAGSAMPYRMRSLLQDRISRRLFVRYGATECGTIAAARPDQHDEDEVVGTPVEDVEVRIIDANGRDVSDGTSGLIGIRAPGVAAGYLNAPGEMLRQFVDGWFYPGDVGRFRADGCLIVEGRVDDMMILNGINIFPQEIERVLQQHPAVRAAAAAALPSSVHGQIPVAAVELEAGQTADATRLLDFAHDQLGLRAPRRILIVDALPRTAEGKILRRALLALLEP